MSGATNDDSRGLAEGWKVATLGELTESTRPICYGVLKPGPDTPGGVPLIRIQDLAKGEVAHEGLHMISPELDSEFARSRLRGGEVLLSIQGTVGRTAVVPKRLSGANISRTVAVIDPDERVRPDFLRLYLDSLAGTDAYDVSGTTRASLNIGALRKLPVPFPALEEQRRIVESTSRLLTEISDGEELLDRVTLLQNVLRSRALAEVLHLGDGTLPDSWLSRKLPEVADLSSGGTPSRSRSDYFGPGHLWVKIGDLTEGKVAFTEESITPAGLANSSAELLPAGTVLLAMYGASIGRTGVLAVEGSTNQAICAMRPRSTEITGEYLLLVLQANRETFVAAGYGGAQPNISQRYLKGFEIPVPPLEEQVSIVQRFADMARAITASEAALAQGQGHVIRLRRSAISHAVSGAL